MPSITLSQEWTDPQGNRHPSGSVLEVDDVTAARLQAEGSALIAPRKTPGTAGRTDWVGPSGGEPITGDQTDWVGPSGGKPGAGDKRDWVGPSGGQP
jgi:hypothetical protein